MNKEKLIDYLKYLSNFFHGIEMDDVIELIDLIKDGAFDDETIQNDKKLCTECKSGLNSKYDKQKSHDESEQEEYSTVY